MRDCRWLDVVSIGNIKSDLDLQQFDVLLGKIEGPAAGIPSISFRIQELSLGIRPTDRRPLGRWRWPVKGGVPLVVLLANTGATGVARG